jgi:NTP pyrophosphatase (non-canonical NTP hydrolase)
MARDMDDYIDFTRTVALYPGAGQGEMPELSYLTLGLTSEAGEVGSLVKKVMRRGHFKDDDPAKIRDELGDVFWYWARLVDAMGFTPEEIMDHNQEKLTGRVKRNELKDR